MWTYLSESGDVLADYVRRDDVPPIGYSVRICGDGGPVRHYEVVRADDNLRTIILKAVND